MSSDILIGYTGMVSFGHSAFFGLGMYGAAAALLAVRPPSLWLAILAGLVGAGAVAACVAFFATRLRDIYFSITTLVFSQIFYVIVFTWTAVTGGENGLTFRQPPLGLPGVGTVAFTPVTLHWFVLAVVTLSYLTLRRVVRSPFGMVLQAIRENEPRVRAIGYHVERYKIVAVLLSGLFAGLAGVLYAIQNKFAAPDFIHFVALGRNGDLQRHGRHGHAGRSGGRGGLLPAPARRRLPVLHRVLPDPGGPRLHGHGHLPAAGAARIPPPDAEPLSAGRFQSASGRSRGR